MIKIILRSPQNNEYVLCHGPTRGLGLHVGPDRLMHDDNLMVGNIKRLGAAWSKFESRGNQETQLAFAVHVEFATIHEAVNYAWRYKSTIPREGSVIVVCRENNIDYPSTITNCVIHRVPCQQVGVSVLINYTIIGGQVTT